MALTFDVANAPDCRSDVPIARACSPRIEAAIGLLAGVDVRTAWFHYRTRTTGPMPVSSAAVPADGLGEADTAVMERTVRAGVDAGVPVLGILDGLGAASPDDPAGLAALHGWGEVAAALVSASGLVPTVLVVDGPCLAGMALLLGLADLVVFTDRATAYVSDPHITAELTGTVAVDPATLGGPGIHRSDTGVAALVTGELDEALVLVGDVLSHLPGNNVDHAAPVVCTDPIERPCEVAAGAVPADGRAAYDVRTVIGDIVDHTDFVELRDGFGTAVVTGFARVGGVPVGVVANQPGQLAGALDIEASQKAARFVRWCDAFGIALLTFVDTPGFRPGKDQEWRGMIRHGAQLAFAYAEATVPRICVLLRKAYGGAFIVMDCKTMGNDVCLAWPDAEVAVMGAPGAVEILNRRELASATDLHEQQLVRKRLETAYEERYLNPRIAAERGYVDAVIDPVSTRSAVAGALVGLGAKRERLVARRHANTPL